MTQMISRRSDSWQLDAHTEPSIGWAGGMLLALPRFFVRAVRRAWAAKAEEKHLQDLSDHHLRDLGIRREHISYIVRHGWDR